MYLAGSRLRSAGSGLSGPPRVGADGPGDHLGNHIAFVLVKCLVSMDDESLTKTNAIHIAFVLVKGLASISEIILYIHHAFLYNVVLWFTFKNTISNSFILSNL